MALSKRSMYIRKAFERVGSDLYRATEVSCECAILIAKAKKPHNFGEHLIKRVCIKFVERMCEPQVVDKVKTAPFSDSTTEDEIYKIDKITVIVRISCTRSLEKFLLQFSWMSPLSLFLCCTLMVMT